MKIFMTIFVFLKLISTLSNAQENFNISRGSEGPADVFQLPASLCGESKGARECPLMGGRKIGECQCVCNMRDERGVMYKSTFGFYDGEWKCQNNTVLRNNTGCLVVQDSMNDPIPTLDRSNKILHLSMQKIPLCDWGYRQKFGNSTYQGCKGTWKPLDKYAIERNFKLLYWFRSLRYLARQPIPRGRLIKLVFSACKEDKPVACFLLKTKGNASCPVPYIATTSPPLTLATTLSSSSFLTRVSTDVATNLSTSTTRLSDPNVGGSTAGNRFLIAGSASGVIALMIVIGVMMVIIKRTCKRKSTAREREGTPRTDEDGNQEPNTYANATSIRNAYNCTDNGLQRSIDPIPVADYVNVHRSDDVVSDGLEYEIAPFGEYEACRQKHPSETLNSSVYCSLVPNVYGSLQVPQKTHKDDTHGQVTCASQTNENTYQQLNTFSQQSHGEYQALNYKR